MPNNQTKVPAGQPAEPSQTQRLNWLRAAVLGANDGIVSIAGLVVGVASANPDKGVIATAGIAGIVAGALSMAAGEYVSVSSQRDSERALLKKQSEQLESDPETELQALAGVYEHKGLSKHTARQVAIELTAHDAFRAHAEARHGLNPDDLTNPWHAAWASALAFVSGAAIPLALVLVPPMNLRIPVTFAGVVIALVATGFLSAHAGGADKSRAMIRVVLGGAAAMAVTFVIGRLTGTSV